MSFLEAQLVVHYALSLWQSKPRVVRLEIIWKGSCVILYGITCAYRKKSLCDLARRKKRTKKSPWIILNAAQKTSLMPSASIKRLICNWQPGKVLNSAQRQEVHLYI